MANFTALAAARHAVLARVGWDVERHGLQGAPPVTVITHAGSHVTRLRLAPDARPRARGRPRPQDRADDQGRMRPDALRAELAGIDGPVIVCAQAGNVNSGAFDPLDELVPLAHERGAWIHVDGAFGIWAAAVPSLRHLMRGHDGADSWSTDAHKWLNVPYDSGLVFVRDAAAHHAAMTLGAAYYIETEGARTRPLQLGPRVVAPGARVRRARRAPVARPAGLIDLIERDCALARQMAERLAAGPGSRSSTRSCSTRSSSGSRVSATIPTGPPAMLGPAPSSTPSSATARAGSAGRRGPAGPRCASRSRAGRRPTDDIDRSADAILGCVAEVDRRAG